MSRPKLPESSLKHPRRIRASQTTGLQLDIPEPSKAEKKRWKLLVDACIEACLRMERSDNLMRKNKVRVRFADYSKRPSWMPIGRAISKDDNKYLVEYSCDLMLLKLWQNKLAPYNPEMLTRGVQANRWNLTALMRDIDNEVDSLENLLYNVEFTLEG